MTTGNRFLFRNDSPTAVVLNIEPEGVHFSLEKGEEVIVTDRYSTDPVTIKLSVSKTGTPVVSIWPGDGDVRVEKDGIDVFDLVTEQGVTA